MIPPWIDESVKLLSFLLLSSTGAASIVYFVLQKRIENRFAKELEKAKHELQLEQQRMSIVFEHQKDSFRKVLAAMDKAVQEIEDRVEPDGGPWGAIPPETHTEFQRLVSVERLFLDAEAGQAIDLFASCMWEAVVDGSYEQYPESEEVRRAYEKMILISNRLSEHFRNRVGLAPESPDPLMDVAVLGACILINIYAFQTFDLPTKGILKWREGETAEEIVTVGKENVSKLKSELLRLKEAMSTDQQRTSLFYHTLRM